MIPERAKVTDEDFEELEDYLSDITTVYYDNSKEIRRLLISIFKLGANFAQEKLLISKNQEVPEIIISPYVYDPILDKIYREGCQRMYGRMTTPHKGYVWRKCYERKTDTI